MNPTVVPASPGDPVDLKRQTDIAISSSPGSETASEEVPTLVVRMHSMLDDDELDPMHADEQPPRSPGRVRFRPRVRITSGLHGHRHKARAAQERPAYSTSSSASGSRSSSLSAPLRSEEVDWSGKPGWGTLGQRVAIMAQSHAQRRQQRALREQELFAKSVQLGIHSEYAADERTPLTKAASYLYMTPDGPNDSGPAVDPADRLARDIDMVFGPWPTRLWNHHWWRWQIEPILCCHWLTESLNDDGC
ncbi:hypothetical protein HYPSUDRAFT_61397 [Hypholoma sublateritium FD-334 SS-4]|uniref:Uncharacterized protein n=1 Tax=Hypholoma sublateritium (strain FD-334 SS-4) TaxID=945553 RepID=A0A0D2LMT5_HYPSF|nr:hypothetical protein HYPSUDRAFT_61397 [Hypholoma sublateritium FD-334 SS-4]